MSPAAWPAVCVWGAGGGGGGVGVCGCVGVCVGVLSRFSCVQICATLWTLAHQAPLSMARILEWVVTSCSRGPSQPRDPFSKHGGLKASQA